MSEDFEPIQPGEIAFRLDLTAAELKVTHTALRSLLDDYGREAPGRATSMLRTAGARATPPPSAGKVCLYLTGTIGLNASATGNALPVGGSRYGFEVQATQNAADATGVWDVWAYTAP